jgi:hypothetical protein
MTCPVPYEDKLDWPNAILTWPNGTRREIRIDPAEIERISPATVARRIELAHPCPGCGSPPLVMIEPGDGE